MLRSDTAGIKHSRVFKGVVFLVSAQLLGYKFDVREIPLVKGSKKETVRTYPPAEGEEIDA